MLLLLLLFLFFSIPGWLPVFEVHDQVWSILFVCTLFGIGPSLCASLAIAPLLLVHGLLRIMLRPQTLRPLSLLFLILCLRRIVGLVGRRGWSGWLWSWLVVVGRRSSLVYF